MSDRYEIGQIRKLDEDMECRSALTDELVKVYPKGTEFTVSSSGFCLFPDGKMSPLSPEIKVYGYDTRAIAHRIMKYLKHDTAITDVIDEDDDFCNERSFRNAIEEALYDIL